jgi:hypothetical protein
MPNQAFHADSSKLKGYLRAQPWCLCIGAGVSKGLIPDWYEVTYRILNRAFGIGMSYAEFDEIQKKTGWTLDSWIQSSLNIYLQQGKTIEDFNSLLEDILYEDLLAEAAKHGLQEPLAKMFSDPLAVKRDDVEAVYDFFVSRYSTCSSTSLAKVLLEAEQKDLLPSAIITFDADAILHTVFVLFHLRNHMLSTGGKNTPKQVFQRVYRAISISRSMGNGKKIPIYHLHGCLLPKTHKLRDSREKLIFPESSYQALAGSVFTWAQTTFLHYVQSHRMVFVGLSMSDPNIRKWLSWWTVSRKQDIQEVAGLSDHWPMEHIWLSTIPKKPDHVYILENSLWHLGTRICWLNDWTQLDLAFKKLLSM